MKLLNFVDSLSLSGLFLVFPFLLWLVISLGVKVVSDCGGKSRYIHLPPIAANIFSFEESALEKHCDIIKVTNRLVPAKGGEYDHTFCFSKVCSMVGLVAAVAKKLSWPWELRISFCPTFGVPSQFFKTRKRLAGGSQLLALQFFLNSAIRTSVVGVTGMVEPALFSMCTRVNYP